LVAASDSASTDLSGRDREGKKTMRRTGKFVPVTGVNAPAEGVASMLCAADMAGIRGRDSVFGIIIARAHELRNEVVEELILI
jgi:hypothetical protein